MSIRKRTAAALEAVAGVIVSVAAWVYRSRAGLLDLVAGACGLACFWMIAPQAGLGFAFVWLTVQAYGIERKERP